MESIQKCGFYDLFYSGIVQYMYYMIKQLNLTSHTNIHHISEFSLTQSIGNSGP